MKRNETKRMSGIKRLVLAMLASITVTAPAEPDAHATMVIVVRHAEKADDSDDPPLSAAGQARARALVDVLEASPPDAIYASQYRRTQDTVAPAAVWFGLNIRIEPVERPIEDWARRFAQQLIAEHPGETVLVAGHSNTVPVLVAALCSCEVEAIDDSVYDRIYVVRGTDSPNPVLQLSRFGAAPD